MRPTFCRPLSDQRCPEAVITKRSQRLVRAVLRTTTGTIATFKRGQKAGSTADEEAGFTQSIDSICFAGPGKHSGMAQSTSA